MPILVIDLPSEEQSHTYLPVTLTTDDGEVYEIPSLPADVGRATAIASEEVLARIWNTGEEDNPFEVMTRAEMEARFVSEWVLIADPDVDKHLNVVRGAVVAHSKEHDEVSRKAIHLRIRHSAFLYIGDVPDDVVIVL